MYNITKHQDSFQYCHLEDVSK